MTNKLTKTRFFGSSVIALLLLTCAVPGFADLDGPRFLTGPTEGEPLQIVLDYVHDNREVLGLSENDLVGLRTEQYESTGSGVTHVRLIQRHAEIDVYQGDILANVAADGSIINLHNRFVGKLAEQVDSLDASLSPVQAAERAALHLGLNITEPLVLVSGSTEANEESVVSDGGVSRREIPAKLVWSVDGEARLAWDLSIFEIDKAHWWSLRVDASTGEVIDQVDWAVHDNFRNDEAGRSLGHELVSGGFSKGAGVGEAYRVYEWPVESPHHNPTGAPGSPVEGRSDQVAPWNSASPFGWHDTDGVAGAEHTDTRGNNVDANKVGTRPDCGANLECIFDLDLSIAPTSGSNVSSAIVNLFYWNNIIHDVWYNYGFDEASGNFQENNYGNGGLGSDAVDAQAQSVGNCNATFYTPVDGVTPVMDMFTCSNASPARDGDLDNGVIAHEYAHGISNRLTGGPSNVSCLNNAEQMGEGWSDWFGLAMTIEAGDLGADVRPIGTWLLGQTPTGPGVRNQPYSTDMAVNTHTYADIFGVFSVHSIGEVWATMLWDMTWALVDNGVSQSGLDLDIYNGTGGNNLAMQLIMDGMKLQPCSPGFVDGRDAILLADQNLTGGANQCVIWEAFARRGLGFSASQGSSGSTSDGAEAFDTPPACDFLNPAPAIVEVCADDIDAVFDIDVNAGFTGGDVTMSATGNPAGTTTSFSPNPVTGPLPATTTLTIGNITESGVGQHTITVTGDDGVNNENTTVELVVYTNSLGAATLVSPADGAVEVGVYPELNWVAVPGASAYLVEIDDDPAFGSIDESATVATNIHTAGSALNALTTYYWRVTAENPCNGYGPASAVFSFTTSNIACTVFSATDVPRAIPEGGGTSGTTTSVLTITETGPISSIAVGLLGTHTFMGDLDFVLTSPIGTAVMIMERNCGSDEDFDLTLDDAAATAMPCPPIGGGTHLPSNPLAPFVGEEINGNWTLVIEDNAGGDSGSLDNWDLQVCYEAPTPVVEEVFSDGFEAGDLSGWSAAVP